MDSKLACNLQKVTPALHKSLKSSDVYRLATIMYASKILHFVDLDIINNCSDRFDCTNQLISFASSRGDKGIIGFAEALTRIHMADLAKELNPENVRETCDSAVIWTSPKQDLSQVQRSEISGKEVEGKLAFDQSGNPYLDFTCSPSHFRTARKLHIDSLSPHRMPQNTLGTEQRISSVYHENATLWIKLILEKSRHLASLCSSFNELNALRELVITNSLLCDLPDTFGSLHNLERLLLEKNGQLASLCSSFGELKALKELVIKDSLLSGLPDTFGKLHNLEILRLENNERLSSLCSSFGELIALKELVISDSMLSYLPDNFGKLCDLQSLTLRDNEQLENLCSSFGQLQKLKQLDIVRCEITSLPDYFGNLPRLQKLTLWSNEQLEQLGSSFGQLQELRELEVRRCGLSRLPSNFGHLPSLEKLTLEDNELLSCLGISFGELKMLKELVITNSLLSSLPENFGRLFNLEKLRLEGNEKLCRLCSSFGELKALKELVITSSLLTGLPGNFENLQSLETLTLWKVDQLEKLNPSFGKLQALKEVRISGCGLCCLPDSFADLCNLQRLTLLKSRKLVTLCPLFGQLKVLKELRIGQCGLRSLPKNFGHLDNLQRLSLDNNEQLETLDASFGDLKSLQELLITNCLLACLPTTFGNLPRLENLTMKRLEGLNDLGSSFPNLTSLKHLVITNCGLTVMPDSFRSLQKLKSLDLSGNRLEAYPAFTLHLRNLETLDLSSSPWKSCANSIEDLPAALAETSLKELMLHGNPIKEPPSAIWMNGVRAIKSYMKEILPRKEFFCADTVNMIGESNGGKTSIAQSLVEGAPCLADNDDRTRVMQQLLAKIDLISSVHINDFGGHHIYHSVIPIFLPFNGLSILAYNLKNDMTEQKKEIKKWLLTAIAKSSMIRVIVAGTRSDLVTREESFRLKDEATDFVGQVLKDQKAGVREALEERPNEELETLLQKLEKAVLHFVTVSCKEHDGNFNDFRSLTFENLRSFDSMPSRWCLVMKDIGNYKGNEFPYIEMKQVKKIYRNHINDDPNFQNLPVILSYLVDSSQILWLKKHRRLKRVIFHSPLQIVEICTNVLDHNEAPLLASKLTQGYERDLEQYKRGILTGILLKRMLSSYVNCNIDVVIDFLQHFNLMSEINLHGKGRHCGRTFVITSNLPKEEPLELRQLEKQRYQSFAHVYLCLTFVGSIVPLSFFDASLALILTAANELSQGQAVTEQWQCGLLVSYDDVDLVMIHTTCEEKITLTASARSCNSSPWLIMTPVLRRLQEYIASSWPGASPRWELLCPECKWLDERCGGTILIGYIVVEECTSQLTVDEVHKHEMRTFRKCMHSVPQILCQPMAQGSFTAEEKSKISKFYAKLLTKLSGESFVDKPFEKRRKTNTTGFLRKSLAPLKENNIESTQSSDDTVDVARKLPSLYENLRIQSCNIACKLTKQETQLIIARLRSTEEKYLLDTEYEHLKVVKEPTTKATELIDILLKKGEPAIKCFVQLLQNIGRIDLHDLVITGSVEAGCK